MIKIFRIAQTYFCKDKKQMNKQTPKDNIARIEVLIDRLPERSGHFFSSLAFQEQGASKAKNPKTKAVYNLVGQGEGDNADSLLG